jgi:predicted dehydrogenase
MSDPAWHQAATLVREGAIGKPIHAECGYFRVGDWGERGMPIDDANAQPGAELDWQAFLGDAPARPFDVSRFFRWRMYEEYSGGPVTDLFPHSLTPTAFILGVSLPEKVVALGGKHRYVEREVPDTFNMLIEYPQDVTVAVLGTQANDYSGTGDRGAGGRRPTIRGWEGTITFEGNEIWVRPLGDKEPVKKVPIEGGEDWLRFFRSFLECCQTRKKPAAGEDIMFAVQTALHMGMLANRSGRTACFDPIRRLIAM